MCSISLYVCIVFFCFSCSLCERQRRLKNENATSENCKKIRRQTHLEYSGNTALSSSLLHDDIILVRCHYSMDMILVSSNSTMASFPLVSIMYKLGGSYIAYPINKLPLSNLHGLIVSGIALSIFMRVSSHVSHSCFALLFSALICSSLLCSALTCPKFQALLRVGFPVQIRPRSFITNSSRSFSFSRKT